MYKVIVAASLLMPPTGALAEPGGKYDPDKMICKTTKITGSRLTKERICLTRRQWDRLSEETQNAQEKAINRSLDGSAPRG